MRLLFFGTPEFAVPTLDRLAGGPHTVVGVVSQPDRPRGRGRTPRPSPVSAFAQERGLPLLRPERVGAQETVLALREWRPDLGVVVAFGQFLPKRVRELPALGYLVNAHASLLPRYRGAAPIVRALLDGARETGISVMRVEREMDAGPVALVRRLEIGPDEDAGHLGDRLARLAAEAIAEVVDRIAADRVEWREQDPADATVAPKIGPEELEIDWTQSARRIADRVRALAPAPGARTRLDGELLRVLAARAEPGRADAAPGSVSVAAGAPLRVATGEGWLVPTRVQRAGGRPLEIEAFLRGRPIPDGARLGGPGAGPDAAG